MNAKKKEIELNNTDAGADGSFSADENQDVATIGSTPIDLVHLGLNHIAYVRRAVVDDKHVWTIHGANGTPLGAAQNLEEAWGAVVQNGLEPLHVH